MPDAPHLAFRWSPLVAWALVPIAALGFWPWVAAHFVALAGFGSWRIAAVALVSWPFALDVVDGGAMVFVVLAAWWAYRGSTVGTAVFLALGVLIPRPLHLPLMAWIIWRRPEWRIPFAVLFLAHAGAVVAMGWHVEWAARLLASGWDIQNVFNIGPSRIIGTLWVPVGVALGAWLTARGRLGLASLAFSPYILPQYLLWLVLEFQPRTAGPRAPLCRRAVSRCRTPRFAARPSRPGPGHRTE
jgi:hypothetical protein